ncbi:hypothetical protein [Jiangella rhizosphaerae]|uniref:PRC-barrel domain containing protein n=1 Tax=Jiangella rhizosphaerae TaxID=2293569 RepID=A0A418KNE4_9ACTN|nr:hypothetical protein [Jiangella rhizosphaerae]RIQ20536.1 hypothetical protein DY240_17525 [Jiangella rhizosphaerae]
MTNANDAADRLGDVREGMTVVDALGEELGTVAEVKLGDPEAVTDAGQEPGPGGDDLIGSAARALWSGPDLPAQEVARLRRVGYLRVDRSLAKDLYAAADEVHRVDGEMVRLSVPADHLVSG